MKIENINKNQFIELKYKYDFDWYTTYDISWKNNSFSGKSVICLNDSLFINFKNDISNLDVWNQIKINDNDSDSYIEVKKIDNLWHYEIVYQIWGSHQDNYCKLILNTDNIGVINILKL